MSLGTWLELLGGAVVLAVIVFVWALASLAREQKDFK